MKWKKDPTNDWSTDTNMDMTRAIIKYCQVIKLVYPIIIFVMVLYIIDQLSN